MEPQDVKKQRLLASVAANVQAMSTKIKNLNEEYAGLKDRSRHIRDLLRDLRNDRTAILRKVNNLSSVRDGHVQKIDDIRHQLLAKINELQAVEVESCFYRINNDAFALIMQSIDDLRSIIKTQAMETSELEARMKKENDRLIESTSHYRRVSGSLQGLEDEIRRVKASIKNCNKAVASHSVIYELLETRGDPKIDRKVWVKTRVIRVENRKKTLFINTHLYLFISQEKTWFRLVEGKEAKLVTASEKIMKLNDLI